jgi:hypothetical protein
MSKIKTPKPEIAQKDVKGKKINKAFNFFSFSVFAMFLIISVTATFTGAFFNLAPDEDTGPVDFGRIQLNNLSNNFEIVNPITQETLSTILPGDSFEVQFSIENAGTADMYVRFRPALIDTDPETPLDTSNFVIQNITAYYTVGEENFSTNYVAKDFAGTVYYVKDEPMIGNSVMSTNDPADNIVITYQFTAGDGTNENDFKNASLQLDLAVHSVQYANNYRYDGPVSDYPYDYPIYDPASDDYNIYWE